MSEPSPPQKPSAESKTPDAQAQAIPEAIQEPIRPSYLPWVLPFLTVALTLWLVRGAWRERGESVRIRFDAGHGLEEGNDVRYRGISVGRVERVAIANEGTGIEVFARLDDEARWMARSGSRFWIARPEVGLAGVRGLDTLVGPRYVQVLPAEEQTESQRIFRGLESPPVEPAFEGGLELVLEAGSRQGLTAGAPVLYRDMPVGSLVSLRLATDAQRVEFRAVIAPEYAELVREGTRFYRAPGFELSASILNGFHFEVTSLEGLISGAVAFATPQDGGESAATGRRFPLYDEADRSWLEWSPTLAVGAALLPKGSRVPEPRRAALAWKEGRLLKSSERKLGWCLRLQTSLVGPVDVLRLPRDAREGTTTLEVAGQTLLPLEVGSGGNQLAGLLPMTTEAKAWPNDRVRRPSEPEAAVVFGDPGQGPRAIDAVRLSVVRSGDAMLGFEITDGGGFSRDWHGAPVLAREDGLLIGVLIVEGSRTRIGLVPKE